MAITRATNLAAVGSGLGTSPAQPIDISTGIQMDGSSTGIITANTFSGTATNAGTAANIGVGATGYSLVLSGDLTAANVTVGGTLTYDDVTNIDSIGLITARSGVSIADSIFHTGDTNTAIRFPAADTFTVETGGSEALRVDSSQQLLLGTTSSFEVGSSAASDVQLTGSLAFQSLSRFSANGAGPNLIFGKSRNASPGSYTVVQDDDDLGNITFAGDDGTDLQSVAARIVCEVDGTPGSNDMPGRLLFNTTSDGASDPTERMRITSTGGIHFNNAELIERVNITAGKLSDNTTINLDNGMVHYFTTTETTTAIPNITTTVGINTNMATGDTMSVTIITTAAAAGYSTGAKIDAGSTLSVLWNGGTDPSAGGSSGVDVYTYQVIKTGDAAFTVLGNVSNFA